MKYRPRRKRRPSVAPERGQPLVDSFFARIRLQDTARMFFAMRAFELCAGPRIRQKARAEKMRGAILFVRVVSSAWSQELYGLKAQLLEKIRATVGGEGVMDLRFAVGPIDELPTFLDGDAAAIAEDTIAAAITAPPSMDVEHAFTQVADDELRRELKHLFQRLGEKS